MTNEPLAELESWLTEPLSPAVAESVSRLRAADGVKKVCLMPDVHLASEVCVGAVVATEGIVYPQAVGGDMGTPSFHTMGRGCDASLTSCSHGAGRRMSRTEARRAITPKAFRRQVGGLWFDHRRADHLRDESPAAYKDIREVMRAQKELTKTVRELRPVLSYKGV